jgi:hypothetical protein
MQRCLNDNSVECCKKNTLDSVLKDTCTEFENDYFHNVLRQCLLQSANVADLTSTQNVDNCDVYTTSLDINKAVTVQVPKLYVINKVCSRC